MTDQKKMIRMDFKAYFADTKRLFDTTVEAEAKEAGIYNERYTYTPMAYVVGSNRLYCALDEAIKTAKVGKEVEVSIPSEEAAGPRDNKLVELYPIKDFHRQEINPYPGLPVTLGNKTGVVMTVSGGRVKVDFNNPLAGHDLLYKFTVVEEIKEPLDKAKAIVELNFGGSEGFKFDFPAGKVVVTLPEESKFSQEWPVARFKIVQGLREAFSVDTIEFVEVWIAVKKEEKKE